MLERRAKWEERAVLEVLALRAQRVVRREEVQRVRMRRGAP